MKKMNKMEPLSTGVYSTRLMSGAGGHYEMFETFGSKTLPLDYFKKESSSGSAHKALGAWKIVLG